MPVLRAISLLFIPAALSRRTSPILRMDNLLLGIDVLLGRCLVALSTEHRCPPRFSKASPTPPDCQVQLVRACSLWAGLAVRFESESVSGFDRNQCPESSGLHIPNTRLRFESSDLRPDESTTNIGLFKAGQTPSPSTSTAVVDP